MHRRSGVRGRCDALGRAGWGAIYAGLGIGGGARASPGGGAGWAGISNPTVWPIGSTSRVAAIEQCKMGPLRGRRRRNVVFRSETRSWPNPAPRLADPDSLLVDHAHTPMPTEFQIDFAQALRRRVKVISVDVDDHELNRYRAPGKRMARIPGQCRPVPAEPAGRGNALPGNSTSDALRKLREIAPARPMIAVKQGADRVIVDAAGDRRFYPLPSIARPSSTPPARATPFPAELSRHRSHRIGARRRPVGVGFGLPRHRIVGRQGACRGDA